MVSQIPIFPLNNILFPDARLSLRVFEARYVDMISACLRKDITFGVCLIAQGAEVGDVAKPFDVGVEAHIEQCEVPQPSILQINVRGGRRFRILQQEVSAQGLIVAAVEWIDDVSTVIPDEYHALLPLLGAVVADAGKGNIPLPHRFDDLNWVGYRYAEILPIPMLAKQRLLELDDGLLRLSIILEYLRSKGLVE